MKKERSHNSISVYKAALSKDGGAHINAIVENSEILCQFYPEENVASILGFDECRLQMQYIEGTPWGEEIVRAGIAKGKDALLKKLQEWHSFVRKNHIETGLGDRNAASNISLQLDHPDRKINVDMNLGNILISSDSIPIIIDYEWLVPSAPIKFVIWRALMNFYYNEYPAILPKIIDLESLLTEFKINKIDIAMAKEWENAFQTAVGTESIEKRYMKENQTLSDKTSLKKNLKKRIKQKLLFWK